MDQKYTHDTMFYYYKDLDENLAWLIQKTEESKRNKGNFTFPLHTVNVIELKVIKKWQLPIFTSTSPFQGYTSF